MFCMQASESIDKKGLVFCSLYTPKITNNTATLIGAPCSTHLDPSRGIKTKSANIHCVWNHRKISFFAKEPFAGVPAARGPIGRIGVSKRAKSHLYYITFSLALTHGGVAVGDTHWHARLLGNTKGKHRERINVTMHDWICVSHKQLTERLLVLTKMLVGRHLEQTTA